MRIAMAVLVYVAIGIVLDIAACAIDNPDGRADEDWDSMVMFAWIFGWPLVLAILSFCHLRNRALEGARRAVRAARRFRGRRE